MPSRMEVELLSDLFLHNGECCVVICLYLELAIKFGRSEILVLYADVPCPNTCGHAWFTLCNNAERRTHLKMNDLLSVDNDNEKKKG